MSHPPAHVVSQSQYLVRGQVTIHATAVIAAGTILQAAPNCHLTIGAGVCIGQGTILQAWGGDLTLEPGVVLGARCLVMGQGEIGTGACLGAEVTVWNTSVAGQALIAPRSLLGDPSRSCALTCLPAQEIATLPSPWDSEPEAPVPPPAAETPSQGGEVAPAAAPESETVTVVEPDEPQPLAPPAKPPVVGQVYINQLLITLFPERDFLKKNI